MFWNIPKQPTATPCGDNCRLTREACPMRSFLKASGTLGRTMIWKWDFKAQATNYLSWSLNKSWRFMPLYLHKAARFQMCFMLFIGKRPEWPLNVSLCFKQPPAYRTCKKTGRDGSKTWTRRRLGNATSNRSVGYGPSCLSQRSFCTVYMFKKRWYVEINTNCLYLTIAGWNGVNNFNTLTQDKYACLYMLM